MRLSGLVILVVAGLVLPLSFKPCFAQYQAPSGQLLVSGKSASTWSQGQTDVLQIEGPVTVDLDRVTLGANQAVLWITPDPAAGAGAKRVQVALIGNATVRQGEVVRSGERMIVTAHVLGRIQLRADERATGDRSESPLYRAAEAMRPPSNLPAGEQPEPLAPPPPTTTQPSTRPTTARRPATTQFAASTTRAATATAPASLPAPFAPPPPVSFTAQSLETERTAEGDVAIVLTGGVHLRQRRPTGDYVEMRADRAVLYTPLREPREAMERVQGGSGASAASGAYLEGDVRMVYTPAATPNHEQRMEANRVYYEFATDRAVLTDAVLRTIDPNTNFPINVRARTIRQLAQGEYRADDTQLSVSSFATPSYSVNAERIYVRQDRGRTADEADRVVYEARHAGFRVFDVPIFYWPYVTGSITDAQAPIRTLGVENSDQFGVTVFGEFGLLELLNQPPMRDLDLSLRLDYHTERGPAAGLNANYQGGFVTETSKDPWSFEGEFRSYFVYDHGVDNIGRPIQIPDDGGSELRGRALWEHQHRFPEDWTFQGRAAYVSDQNFLEQWFPRTFDTGLPHDVSLYLKRQRETEAFTLLLQFQPNDVVTTADLMQEQFEVERLPEVGYRRIGESLAGDRLTFNSQNTVAGLHFQPTQATLAEQGFVPGWFQGLPSLGQTGITDETVYRGDFRQEFAYPINAGNFKLVPYAVGRYTAYSDSPGGDAQHRLFGGVGAKVTTSFWKVDDAVRSEFWDLHRMRHVIEPEVNVFTSAQTVDRNEVFVFEEPVDSVNDVSAAQIALRQRWQTYRGGPGRWRSVDWFTLNVEANLFANQPTREQLRPIGFRGLYFASLPEASIPRNALNADAAWRVSDNTAILADAQYNLDEDQWATASIGIIARREDKVAYYIGNRYIKQLNSNIATVAVDYELTRKYFVGFRQSYDFGQGENVVSEVSLVRRFDTFALVVSAQNDERADQQSVNFSLIPNGVGYALSSGQFESVLRDDQP